VNLSEAIENRRSVRNYTTQKVDKASVEKLLHAAVQAPSASNTQPWTFVVIQDAKLLKDYSDRSKSLLLGMIDFDNSPIRNTAPCSPTPISTSFTPPAHSSSSTPNRWAAQLRRLLPRRPESHVAAHGLGLGTCWIGFAGTLLDTRR
jgi:nitroreductase